MHWANEIGDRKRLVNTEVYSLFKRFTLLSSSLSPHSLLLLPPSERDISQWDYGPFISHETRGRRALSRCYDGCCSIGGGNYTLRPTPSDDYIQDGSLDWNRSVGGGMGKLI